VDFSTQRLFPRPFYPQILLQSPYYFGNVFLLFSFLAAAAIIVFSLLNEKPIDASAFEVEPKLKVLAASAG
jgi:hypothetical protein